MSGAADLSAVKPQEETVLEVSTAFLVYIGKNGDVVMTNDLTTALIIERPASPDEVYGACAVVQKDLAARETAMQSGYAVAQIAQQQMAAAQNQQLQQQILNAPNLRNGK